MDNITDEIYFPLKKLRKNNNLSESAFAEKVGISRMTLRNLERQEGNTTLAKLSKAAHEIDSKLVILLTTADEVYSEYSTIGASLRVEVDGPESWRIHFMNLIDEFRRTWDPRLLILPPPRSFPKKLKALLASITLALSHEAGIAFPAWAKRTYFLDQPWFPSESENLKAMAIVESPLYFRKNNIFVLSNFMDRV